MSKPLSSNANRNAPAWIFALFACMGLAVLYFTFPIFKIAAARGWKATPCVVDSSSVKRHPGSKGGSTYSVEINYSYNVDGKPYAGSRYQFFGGSSSGRTGKAAIVARYPAGTKTTCYVNPFNPYESVIERGFTSEMWFSLIPLVFVAVGVGGWISMRRVNARTPEARWRPNVLRHATDFSTVSTAPRELKPTASPLGTLMFLIFFALFWNGIVSVFVAQAYKGWRGGHMDWFLGLFLIPFVLIGIVMVFAVLHQFLALFNPKVHFKVSPGAVAIGDTVNLEWTLVGRVSALSELRIWIEGCEEATYQNGKNTSTATEIFYTAEIFKTTSRTEFNKGEARVTLPSGTMHSLDTGHNRIVWKIRIKGLIRHWPDLTEDFALAVLPLQKEAA